MNQKFKNIFAFLSEDESKDLMKYLEADDLTAVKDYLMLLKGKMKNEITSSVKILTAFDLAKGEDYKWYRYSGKDLKSIAYDGNVVNILPREVYGISNNNNDNVYDIIIPATEVIYKVDKNIVLQLEEESQVYQGNINELLDLIRKE